MEGGGGRDVEVVVLFVVLDVGDVVAALLGVDGDCHLGGGVGLHVEAEEEDLVGDEDLDEALGDLHLSCPLFYRTEFLQEVGSDVLLLPLDFLRLLGQQGTVHCDGVLNVRVVDVDWILRRQQGDQREEEDLHHVTNIYKPTCIIIKMS